MANDTEFQRLYKGLNTEQKRAVDTIEGPVMVIAGPGTGKTTILTLRIANILRQTDTPASGILAITFTDAGVKAMRMKLRKVIGSRADEVRIHTFHAFASSVLAEFPDHVPHLLRSKQITNIEAEEMVRGLLKEAKFKKIRPLGNPDYYVKEVLSAVSAAKREAWTPEMVRENAKAEIERVKNDESSISTRGATKGELKADAKKQIEKAEKTLLFADVYEAYEAKKKEEKKIDFDDQIFELLNALRTDELLLRMIQEKFLYILVDEHQDTNDSQNAIVRLIADFFEEPNLFVVGDEKQAVYRFQGASVENFLSFQKKWRAMQVISLKSNYRSHQHILDAGFSLIENNYEEGQYEDLRVKLEAGSGEKARLIELVTAGNMAAGEKYLVEKLQALVAEKGTVNEKTAAIIVKRNRDVERIASLCEEYGIPAVSERGVNIFEHPIGRLFFELISFLADASKVEALALTFAGGLWHVSFADSAKHIRSIRADKLDEVLKAVPAIKLLHSELTERGSLSYLIFAAKESGLLDRALKSPLSSEVWRGVIALATELAGKGYADDPRKLIEALLEYRAAAETRSVKVSSGAPEAQICITTAHSSKGLEYDEVFIPLANEESWLSRPKSAPFLSPREKNEGDDLRDARRLFYVALTRAKKHVTLIAPLAESGGRLLTPLRFLNELAETSLSRVDLPPSEEDSKKPGKVRGTAKRAEELVLFAKSILLEKGLSVTALNHFVTCPQQFLFKSVLKVPEPPSASSEKGNAMHEAIARVWHLDDKSEKRILSELEASFKEYFDRSLLPAFEKSAVKEELKSAAPAVAAALAPHVSQEGEVATESWVETEFASIFEKEPVRFSIHGKLDAQLVQADVVHVFDYKTGDTLSVAAIKGETKNSSDKYFRQLVFYKMLLSAQSRFKGKSILPALMFVEPDEKGRCKVAALPIEKTDVEKVEGEIQTLIDAVWSGKIASARCEEEGCEWCALSKHLGE